MPFTCTICEEESTRICVACTKDTCGNHLCEKCRRCSDCCDCEVHLDSFDDVPVRDAVTHVEVQDLSETPREPQPHPHPMPDPDPAPEPDPMPIPGVPGPEE